MVKPRREVRVHVRARRRVVEVEDERQAAQPRERDPGEARGVGHHEHDDRARPALADDAPPGAHGGQQPEDRLVRPHEQLEQLVEAQTPQQREQPHGPAAAHDLHANPAGGPRAGALGQHGDVVAGGEAVEQLAGTDPGRRRVRPERLREAEQQRARARVPPVRSASIAVVAHDFAHGEGRGRTMLAEASRTVKRVSRRRARARRRRASPRDAPRS